MTKLISFVNNSGNLINDSGTSSYCGEITSTAIETIQFISLPYGVYNVEYVDNDYHEGNEISDWELATEWIKNTSTKQLTKDESNKILKDIRNMVKRSCV